ncbi:MAG: enoyl-CoA hydratase/isomerase family protein [Planctomycetaceae bacterium]|nr:enoyl-CoA hydratase/isomerase family protein [Planctomycetota bacterium]NUN53094.1 enoyl-CoA hydratase/isomerase family protein [Planctomycetaceae bacterium]
MSDASKDAVLVDWEARDGVAVLTLRNPPANTYSYEMNRGIDEAILRFRFDDALHVLVIRGAGDRFFCAGADIAMLDGAAPSFKYHFCLHANETLLRLEQTPKLVIAALNGHTVGGGLEVAMAADLRIGWRSTAAGAKAALVGLPEVTLGVLPGTGGTQRLARLVGKSRAIELMATGRNVDMAEAERLGIVNRVIEADSVDGFMARVLEYAGGFCPPHRASMAVGHIKRAVQSGAEVPLESGLALERELQQRLFQSEDAREGIGAYNQKRRPSFKGR